MLAIGIIGTLAIVGVGWTYFIGWLLGCGLVYLGFLQNPHTLGVVFAGMSGIILGLQTLISFGGKR
jgi:hypothetical protein